MVGTLWADVHPLLDIQDFAPQRGTGINVSGYFVEGVGDSRVVSAPQRFTDLSQRGVGLLVEKKHRHLSGQGRFPVSLSARQVFGGHLEAAGDRFYYQSGVDRG